MYAGITLSGGQKQRVAIARACYGSYFGTNIYLLDDPLAAVDSHVAAHLFEHVVGEHGMLSNGLRILVTNQLQYLSLADKVVMMDGGKIAAQGSYKKLVATGGAFTALVSEIGQRDREKEDGARGGTEREGRSATTEEGTGGVKKDGPRSSNSKDAAELMQTEERENRGMKLDVLLYYMQAGGFALTSIAFFLSGAQVYW